MRTRLVLSLLSIVSCRSGTSGASAPAGAEGPESWQQSFAVNTADLGPSGTSTYVDLRPGAVSVFRDGDEQLTITVLDETRVVDGVTTRIVEEREEEHGQPIEISRNYFAIDLATKDVYYFGEDVDVFTDGRLTGHPGVWHSGSKEARFGLALPGEPRLGERYYQELAPGVAMDRGEIVGLDETVKTPAGTFEHCLHVRETTPLEADVGHKWYAPGIGLVKDDGCVLVSHVGPAH